MLRSAGSSAGATDATSAPRRDSAFASTTSSSVLGGGFFPLLKDPAALHNEKERLYYMVEEEKIYQIVSQMEKSQVITDQMLSILDSFDEKLSGLESSMLPIHKGTQALTTAQKHIDSTLRETDKIILHYSIATESEDSINSHLINSIDYISYLEWVEKIHASINFFSKNKERFQKGSSNDSGAGTNASSSAASAASSLTTSDYEKYLEKLKKLNKRVMGECEHEFERVLSASSKAPLDLSRTGWPLPATMSAADGVSVVPFQVVPELSVKELSLLAVRMAMAGNYNYFGILLAQRSNFIKSSLKKIFHEEVKFLVNPSSSNPAQQQQPQQVMQIRGSIIAAAGAATPMAAGLVTPGGGGASAGGAISSQFYQKNTHRSVFFLEFFLKLLELENNFLLQLLAHIFSGEELSANGISANPYIVGNLKEESMLPGVWALKNNAHTSSLSAGVGAITMLQNMSLSNLNLHTHANTGSLTVFWGQECYDQIYSNIVEIPLEYFRKKLDQNTYLKDSTWKLNQVFSGFGSSSGGGGSSGGAGGSSATPMGRDSLMSNTPGGVGSSFSSVTSLTSKEHLSLGTSLSNKILILLDVLEHLNALLPRYRIMLKKHAQFEKMTDFQLQITSLARKTFLEYREYMVDYNEKSSSSTSSSSGGSSSSSAVSAGSSSFFGSSSGKKSSHIKDGTIYTLTVETLNFIKRLYEYRRVIEMTNNLLDKRAEAAAEKAAQQNQGNDADFSTGGASSATRGVDDGPLTALVAFLLSGLENNMEAKAKSYNKVPSLSAIFLLNNFHYIARFIKKHEGVFLVSGQSSLKVFLDRYEKLVTTTMKQYRTASWEKVVASALEPSEIVELVKTYTTNNPGSSNYKNARKQIKAKFALFNSIFEELYNTQRHFSIPDSDLRSQLRNDNVELIMQSYRMLYNTFSTVDFSTNPAKYTKYTPQVLETMLNKFFDEEE